MRPLLRRNVATVVAFASILSVAALATAAPIAKIRHPVGWDRIVRTPLPQPQKAASLAPGVVYVPRELGIVPTEDGDFTVVDDPVENSDMTAVRGASPHAVQFVGANVRTNDTAGDAPSTTNSETAIAAHGSQLVSGWNDGLNFGVSPGGSGYSYSSNGGMTWTDGGVPPAPASAIYEGDPSLSVDNAGNFYYANLYTPDGGPTSAISVNHGKFVGLAFSWDPPVLPAATTTDFLDKEWIAVDPVSGNVYLTYTHFLAAGGNQIEFTRSLNQGATWDPPTVLTNTSVESVQGSRVAVGPSGEIQVVYFVFDRASQNNYIRGRRSTTQGTSFGPEVTLPTGPSGITSNYGSGPAGFNRARGIGFPALAFDRTAGVHRGRAYATWEETFNYYYDPLGAGGSIAETEGNDSPATANPITIGQSVTGTMSSTADQDWFKFTGPAGQRVIIYMVPGTGDGFLRLFAGGAGNVANRAMLSYIGFGTGLIVYTLPANGTYYFRVLANSATVGTYTVYTGLDTPDPGDEAARDTRDAILQYSDDGVTWSPRQVVNDDAPLYDNAFPEVAVDATGAVFEYWMDHHNDAAGIGTDFYHAISTSGGVSFASSVKVNDGPAINWNLVSSNLAPNFGDYQGLTADGCNVYADFADGRGGTPDSWMATLAQCGPTATEISLADARALPDRVHLDWYWANGAGATVTLYRRDMSGDWTTLGPLYGDGTGHFTHEDVDVVPGGRYGYRLGVQESGGLRFHGEVWIDVPSALSFALAGVSSNDALHDLQVSFTLPSAAPATLQLMDVSGRAVDRIEVGSLGAGSHTVRLGDRTNLRSGIYMILLTQGARSLSTKTAFIR